MKKQQLDHVLRAAGRITGEKQFVIVGSQSLHGRYSDAADEIVHSAEVDLIVKNAPLRTEWLNVIGQDSPFHEEFGYSAASRSRFAMRLTISLRCKDGIRS